MRRGHMQAEAEKDDVFPGQEAAAPLSLQWRGHRPEDDQQRQQPVVEVWRRTETGEAPRWQGATTENIGNI